MNTAVSPMPSAGRSSGLLSPVGPWLARAARAMRRALEASAAARARAQLLDLAQRCEALQPELAKELRQACRDARHRM